MSAGYESIRSYQRVFRPERRIYQVEGHSLPVPGGVPLRWLAYATLALLAVLALSSGSVAVPLFVAITASALGLASGGGERAALAGAISFGAAWFAGAALGLLDWPLRLIVAPIAGATLATQASPDGRRADRFAASWVALRLSPRRRSLGRSLPSAAVAHRVSAEMWVAGEERR